MSRIPDKVMAQSHTSMSCFETCPRQYEAKYITKEVRFEQGVEAAWGGARCTRYPIGGWTVDFPRDAPKHTKSRWWEWCR